MRSVHVIIKDQMGKSISISIFTLAFYFSLQVGSKCTILTDNYCEDAYDLLQTPVLKKLLVNYITALV